MNVKDKLPEVWQKHWEEIGFEAPSLIQDKMYEVLLEKQNIVGVSPTGSGKTVAYLLPLLQNIKPKEGSQLLILLPSQELGIQVANVAKEWADLLELRVQPIIGGANKKRQIEKLKEKPEIIVGTSGRVLELIRDKKIKAHLLETVVLDEVDQLIEPSELNGTKNVLKALPRDKQVVCVSATGTNVEEELANTVTQSFTMIDVTEEDKSAGTVEHAYLEVPQRKRGDMLRRLGNVKGMKAIVFFNQLQDLGAVAEKLTYDGISVATLASDQNKMERRLAVRAFEENKIVFLLTTDVAARGLDFEDLPYVIHYETPFNAESYLHRSGRTGRMGKTGNVLTLVPEQGVRDIKRVAKQANCVVEEVFVHGGSLQKTNPIAENKKANADKQQFPKKNGKKNGRKDGKKK